jgi:hypothetical protein
VGWAGYENLIYDDCAVSNMYSASLNNPNDMGNVWANDISAWMQRVLGCPTELAAGPDAGLSAGVGFGLVPPEIYGSALTTADLQRLGDYFVEALVQAVANQVTDPANETNVPANSPLLTSPQIDAIQQWVAYEETLYPNQVSSTRFSQSSCPDGG